MLDQDAMSVAADALGYPGASEVIERDRLSVIQAYLPLKPSANPCEKAGAVSETVPASACTHVAPGADRFSLSIKVLDEGFDASRAKCWPYEALPNCCENVPNKRGASHLAIA